MAEEFLALPASEQAEILSGLAHQLKKQPAVLEKDVWVCWALQLAGDMCPSFHLLAGSATFS